MSVLPPNATRLELHLDKVLSRISEIPVPIRKVWDPWNCRADLLPWLAWALSVDEWSADWTEEQKRRTLANSAEVHRKKGTIGAVHKALEPFGLGCAIQEWWQSQPRGKPYTFKIILSFVSASTEIQRSILEAVNRVKPVRSEMTLELVHGYFGQINLMAIAQAGVFTRISFAGAFEPIKQLIQYDGEINLVGVTRIALFTRASFAGTFESIK